MDTEGIGSVCVLLGAGRMKKEDEIDPYAGIILNKKTGDFVSRNEVIATLYASDSALFGNAEKMFLSSLEFSKEKPEEKDILLNIVE